MINMRFHGDACCGLPGGYCCVLYSPLAIYHLSMLVAMGRDGGREREREREREGERGRRERARVKERDIGTERENGETNEGIETDR